MGSNFKKTVLELSLLVQEMTYAVSYRTKTLQECIISVISDFVSCFKTQDLQDLFSVQGD